MRKSLLIMFLLFAAGITANAQKFALIDMEYILKNIPAYQSASNELNQVSKQWQNEVEKLGKEAKSLYDSYQASVKTLSDAQKTKKEEEIVAKEKSAAEMKRTYFGPEGELAKMQAKLINPIQDEIYDAVKELSQLHGYDLVLDRASAAGIIFANPRIDISDEVLRKLGYSN